MEGGSIDDLIIDIVWEVIESILLKSRNHFAVSDHLVHDLKISSDDLSFIFVPELEKRLGVNCSGPIELDTLSAFFLRNSDRSLKSLFLFGTGRALLFL